jgi:hypothetical protein
MANMMLVFLKFLTVVGVALICDIYGILSLGVAFVFSMLALFMFEASGLAIRIYKLTKRNRNVFIN